MIKHRPTWGKKGSLQLTSCNTVSSQRHSEFSARDSVPIQCSDSKVYIFHVNGENLLLHKNKLERCWSLGWPVTAAEQAPRPGSFPPLSSLKQMLGLQDHRRASFSDFAILCLSRGHPNACSWAVRRQCVVCVLSRFSCWVLHGAALLSRHAKHCRLQVMVSICGRRMQFLVTFSMWEPWVQFPVPQREKTLFKQNVAYRDVTSPAMLLMGIFWFWKYNSRLSHLYPCSPN